MTIEIQNPEVDEHAPYFNTDVEQLFRNLLVALHREGEETPDRVGLYRAISQDVRKTYAFYMWECVVWSNKEEETK
jgi:hypothetical protein